jgi:methionine biosynthesis protein MetW
MDANEYNKNFYSSMFNDEAERYYKIQAKKISIVLGLLEKHEKGKILDIGCGDGFISSIIAKGTGAEVHGLDISRHAVSKAKERGIAAKVLNLDRHTLPFKEDSFDAVFCGDVLEHVNDTENLLDNINHVLKPSGYLILSIPNIASWYNRVFLLFGLMPTWVESSLRTYTGNPFIKKGSGHIHAFTKRSLKEMLKLKGFHIEKAIGSPILADGSRKRWKEIIWNGVDSVFAKRVTLASTIILKARKMQQSNKRRVFESLNVA